MEGCRLGARVRFRNYSIEDNLDRWVTPLVDQRVLGFTSKAQVMHYALRKLVDQYLEWGIHPWSTRKQQNPSNYASIAAAILILASIATVALTQPGLTGAATVALDVPRIYNEYAPFIDFFLYLAFFIGIVQVGLGKTLPNKAVTISLATILAIGAASMEPIFGFTLRTFGPVAVGIFLLVSGVLIYRTLRAFEVHRLGAGAVVVILLYLGLAAFLPDLNATLTRAVPVLPLLIVLIVAILVARFSSTGKFGPLPREVATDIAPELAEEAQLVRSFIARTSATRKDSRGLLTALTELLQLVDRVGTVPDARNALAQRMKQVLPTVHPLEDEVGALEDLVSRLERVDLRLFADLKRVYPRLEQKDQKAVRAEIREAVAKVGAEERIRKLAKQIREHATTLRSLIDKSERALRDADIERSRDAIEQAISHEQSAEHLLDEIKDLESALEELTTRELKSLPEK